MSESKENEISTVLGFSIIIKNLPVKEMPLPHTKYRKVQPRQKNLTTNLNMAQVQQLKHFNHDAMKRHKFHQEREVLMANIKKKQRLSTYEGEMNRFEHARIKGPLSAEQNARLEQLKNLLGK